jgi:iron complex transport system substrate-binding protein
MRISTRFPARAARAAGIIASGAAAMLVLSACNSTGSDVQPDTTAQGEGYPVELDSCGDTIRLDDKPERVVMINADPAPLLEAVGALDSVVGRTGIVPKGFPKEQQKKIRDLPEISSKIGETGGTVISLESILELKPDLVLGPPSNIDVDGLAERGVPTYTPDEFCDEAEAPPASFDRVGEVLEDYGTMFDAEDKSDAALKKAEDTLDSVKKTGKDRTAAALYLMEGDSSPYVYGGSSMMTPIMEQVGLDPIYADKKERVSEVSIEHLAAEKPDVIVIGNQSEEVSDPVGSFKKSKMFDLITHARSGKEPAVVHLDYMLADPPTPNSMIGAKKLSEDLQ